MPKPLAQVIAGWRATVARRSRAGAGKALRAALLAPPVAALVAALVAAPLGGLPGMAAAQTPASPEAATPATDFSRTAVRSSKFMAVTAHPLATAAALAVLRDGGAAMDAAVAAQMVLGLVEPQSSGLGGGGFLLHYDARKNQVTAWDGRETAPADIDEFLFVDDAGKPLEFFRAAVGGRSVGVPGLLRMLEAAHARHGQQPWLPLFAPAIRLAEEGFPVSPRLHRLLYGDAYLRDDPAARRLFYDRHGAPWPVGHPLRNPALAETLRIIAGEGSRALHQGPLAAAIVTAVRSHPGNPGRLSERDLARYQTRERPALCSDYRRWSVCGMPPPSSGGIAVAQMLGILAHTGIAGERPHRAGETSPPARQLTPAAAHLFTEASRLAFADRNRYVADTDFVPLPGGSPAPLLAPGYLAGRAALIGERSLGKAPAGDPTDAAVALADGQTLELPGTTHLSIADAAGNAVVLTSSIEHQFGSRIMVGGFLLNNQLTDFAFLPFEQRLSVANRVQPGKRPRSSMAPTLVFARRSDGRRGRLELALGSPGGPQIISYVAKTVIGVLDWGLDIQEAIALPNLGSRNGPSELEAGRHDEALAAALRERGHEVRWLDLPSGLHGIQRAPDQAGGWLGGADPRREGVAAGD